MSVQSVSFFARKVCLVAGVCLVSIAAAAALDVEDVKNLVKNQVPETVILNMVNQSSPIAMSTADVNALRSMGASENLVASIRATGGSAMAPAYGSAPVYGSAGANGEYVLTDGNTSTYPTGPVQHPGSAPVYSQPAPTYSQSTQTYPAQPTPTYSAPAPATTTSTPVYRDPNIYYEVAPGVLSTAPAAPTVVYQTPTVVQTAPVYVAPSYPVYPSRPSFSFSIGVGRGWGPRHYGRPYYGYRRGRW